MLKYIIIICLFLNGCTAYKHNQLQKEIIKKQQSWLNIQYLAMKKPQLTNKKGTMQKQKKYQYLYLMEKIHLNFEYLDEFSLREEFARIQFYKDWLMKLNEKYNYIN